MHDKQDNHPLLDDDIFYSPISIRNRDMSLSNDNSFQLISKEKQPTPSKIMILKEHLKNLLTSIQSMDNQINSTRKLLNFITAPSDKSPQTPGNCNLVPISHNNYQIPKIKNANIAIKTTNNTSTTKYKRSKNQNKSMGVIKETNYWQIFLENDYKIQQSKMKIDIDSYLSNLTRDHKEKIETIKEDNSFIFLTLMDEYHYYNNKWSEYKDKMISSKESTEFAEKFKRKIEWYITMNKFIYFDYYWHFLEKKGEMVGKNINIY